MFYESLALDIIRHILTARACVVNLVLARVPAIPRPFRPYGDGLNPLNTLTKTGVFIEKRKKYKGYMCVVAVFVFLKAEDRLFLADSA